jgi:transposase
MNLLISGLKLPVKLLVKLIGGKRKKTKTEREKKQLAHVRNFAPRHYSWQVRAGKKTTKKLKKYYKKKAKSSKN